jgi:hypothetical protein
MAGGSSVLACINSKPNVFSYVDPFSIMAPRWHSFNLGLGDVMSTTHFFDACTSQKLNVLSRL